jgi:hypothetical protein
MTTPKCTKASYMMMTYSGIRHPMEDNLQWRTTSNGRNLQWTMISNGRQHPVEDQLKMTSKHFKWNISEPTDLICLKFQISALGTKLQEISHETWLGFDRYGHTDTDTPFKNLTRTDTDICFEIHIKPISKPIIGISLYQSDIIPIYRLIYRCLYLYLYSAISNRYRYLYKFHNLHHTDTDIDMI